MEVSMAENKTTQNEASVTDFLHTIADPKAREDSFVILELMQRVTGEKPNMWGSSIVGFGARHYKYESGREGDIFIAGFSPRKQNLTLYISYGFDRYPDLMAKLGKYKTGKACLYIKKLEDIDLPTLCELITRDVAAVRGEG
jgi:hypothetical protein